MGNVVYVQQMRKPRVMHPVKLLAITGFGAVLIAVALHPDLLIHVSDIVSRYLSR